MRKRHVTPALLATILLVVGLAGGTQWPQSKHALPATSTKVRADELSMEALKKVVEAENEKRRQIASNGGELARPRQHALAELSADDTALVQEIGAWQLLAHGSGLELNSDQWSALAAVSLNTQAVRQTYEAGIATVAMVGEGRYRVTIPMYGRAGDALRERFERELRAAVGPAVGAEIIERLGGRLDGHFAGFGVSEQTLDIAVDAATGSEVTRTVTYWNSQDGSDRLVTRRETHFPELEDPQGDRWGALLAMLGT